jgi:hypothetical protein
MLFGNKLWIFYFGHYVNEDKGLIRLPMKNALRSSPLYVRRPYSVKVRLLEKV